MKLTTLLLLALPSAFATVPITDRAAVYIQPLTVSPSPPVPLVEIHYNPSTLDAELVSYTSPSLSTSEVSHLRIGVYDEAKGLWKSSTSMTSAESFAKGYRPTLVLSLDAQGGVLGVAVKGARIDAGETRDFGPRVLVRRAVTAAGPALNRPVVLSAEGKVAVPEVEKTILQKYWWVLLGAVMLLVTAGGGAE